MSIIISHKQATALVGLLEDQIVKGFHSKDPDIKELCVRFLKAVDMRAYRINHEGYTYILNQDGIGIFMDEEVTNAL